MAGVYSDARVRALRPQGRMYEVSCGTISGLFVRVLPSGKKVFFLRHQRGGRDARTRIGVWEPGSLTLEEAQRQAMAILSGAAPAGAREEEEDEAEEPVIVRGGMRAAARSRELPMRRPEPLRPAASPLTVRELAGRFLAEHVDVYLKPGTARYYRRILRDHILPALGDRPFEEVARRDVRALHARLHGEGSIADHAVSVLGSLYSRIIDDWELSDMKNPTAGVKRRPSRRVERFLSPEERRAVVLEIEEAQRRPRYSPGYIEPFSAWALMLLMLTGQRRGEILGLRWAMVDWQHGCFHFPDTKTGQRSVAVSPEVLALLRTIHDATGNPRTGLVLRGRNGTQLSRLNTTWDHVRRAVGIPDVRLHDLRHSFASDALMAGVPLAIVGEMLGHKQPNTTKRYAHLADRVVREALATTTRRIISAVEAPAPASAERPFAPLSDAEWRRVAPLVGAERPRGGPPVDLRRIVDGARWVESRQARWRDLPAAYGSPTTCWRWHKRWREDGTWAQVCEALGPRTGGAGVKSNL